MADPLQDHIEGLQTYLQTLQRDEELMHQALLRHQDKVRRVARALDLLLERETKTGGRTKTRPKPSRDWTPRPHNVEKVFDAINNGATTAGEMAELSGLNRATVYKALNVLRTQERVRKTGVTRAGNSNQQVDTFALMPRSVEDHAA